MRESPAILRLLLKQGGFCGFSLILIRQQAPDMPGSGAFLFRENTRFVQ